MDGAGGGCSCWLDQQIRSVASPSWARVQLTVSVGMLHARDLRAQWQCRCVPCAQGTGLVTGWFRARGSSPDVPSRPCYHGLYLERVCIRRLTAVFCVESLLGSAGQRCRKQRLCRTLAGAVPRQGRLCPRASSVSGQALSPGQVLSQDRLYPQNRLCPMTSSIPGQALSLPRRSEPHCRPAARALLRPAAAAPCRPHAEQIQVHQISYVRNTYEINLASPIESVPPSFSPTAICIFPPTPSGRSSVVRYLFTSPVNSFPPPPYCFPEQQRVVFLSFPSVLTVTRSS